MKRTLSLIAALALGGAFATHNDQEYYFVNPYPTQLQVDVWLDQGGHTPRYFAGENIQIFTRTNQDAYIYLFNVDPSGRVDLILPNPYTPGANFVQGGETAVFPERNAPYSFEVARPYGLNQIIALASKTPLDLDPFDGFSGTNRYRTFFANSEENFVSKMSYVLDRVFDEDWITSTVFYNVR